MPSGKARYNSPLVTESRILDFSDEVKKKLRSFYPRKAKDLATPQEQSEQEEYEKVWGRPDDNFVNVLLGEATWAISALEDCRMSLNKQDIRAECDDLYRTLENASGKLRALSPDIDRLLGADADPLGCADALEALIPAVEGARAAIDGLGRKRRPDEAYHAIAVEMAIRVLRAAKEEGVKVAATGSPDFGYTSVAVQLLKAIGDDLSQVFGDGRLTLDALTWRDIVIEAKKQAPDL